MARFRGLFLQHLFSCMVFLLAMAQAKSQPQAETQAPLTRQSALVFAAQCADTAKRPHESQQQQTQRLLALLEGPDPSAPFGSMEELNKNPCWNSAILLAELGHLLVEQKLYLDAVEYLEASILIDPENKRTQVDYALALSGSGDLRSGSAMLSTLINEPGLPTELTPSLGLANEILKRGIWQAGGLGGLTIGYDSNLLGAPNITGLALTVSGQTAVLPLEPSYLAKKGGYGQVDVQYEARKIDLDGQRNDFYGNARQRLAPEFSDANFTQFNLVGEYGRPSSFGETYANYTLSGYRTFSESSYSSNALGAGVIIPLESSCALRLGLSAALRRYATNKVLSGNYLGLQAIAGCQSPIHWQLIANFGQDIPDNGQRPGGAQNQSSLRALGLIPIGTGQVLIDGQVTAFEDSQGYSPLLANGQTRRMIQYSVKTEYKQPIARPWQAVIGYNWVNQISGLALFSFNSSGPYLALRLSW